MGERIDFGIYVPQLAYGYDDMLARAKLCEELGFRSFWLFDHLYGPHLPTTDALEGWTLATALLTQTTTLRVGHMVLCANFRHPALLGKMATTLDVISGGRIDIGLGSGSVEREHHEGGMPWGSFAERSERLGEVLEIVTQMLDHEVTTFSGKHFQVRDLPNLPRPVQSPRPPVWVGGSGQRHTVPLVARYADVWNAPTYGVGAIPETMAALDAECERIGRDPATLRRSLEAVLVTARDADGLAAATAVGERRFGGPGFGLHDGGFIGPPSVIVDRIGHYVDLGITSFIFFTFDRGGEDTLRLLAEEVLPHFA